MNYINVSEVGLLKKIHNINYSINRASDSKEEAGGTGIYWWTRGCRIEEKGWKIVEEIWLDDSRKDDSRKV